MCHKESLKIKFIYQKNIYRWLKKVTWEGNVCHFGFISVVQHSSQVTAHFSVVSFITNMTEIKPSRDSSFLLHLQLHLTDTNLISIKRMRDERQIRRHRVLKITVTTASSISKHNENYQPPSKHACFLPPTGFIERELQRFFKNQSLQDISRQTVCLAAKEFQHIFIVHQNVTWHKLQNLSHLFMIAACVHKLQLNTQ